MAFDQSTRNRLQKFVNEARNLLTEEFTRQLQATYGLDPKAGSVAAVDSLTHLDNRERQTANVLRDTLAHYLATTHGKGEKDRSKQALSRIVREQAFTVLNRLAALRMAEARGFLLETIAKGYNAKGFQLYKQLAGSSLGETGEAYRNYLYSVFEEFSLDVAVLFDRHSAQGRLFPRESALLELLDLINHHEIEPLWAEDETIGWIYQYFNSQEERKKMRAESQAPRNSRELAVRNQFFTPRYVVEFLTDNTLGRIWYEMTQGKTSLIDNCSYLVRRPIEIFLKPGELVSEQEKTPGEAGALSQEELLNQPVYIPHRAIKDPRCIRMLDPACGSMHFGLYAFDLYERIYEEAWQLEVDLGTEAFFREGDLKSFHQSYESFEDFKIEIPRLIIEHNIHGVDIDPRAVQIAGLSLWQRAQRAWQQQGIKPQQRPMVRKSNIVCAESMPGEKALLQEFSSNLNPPVLGQLLEAVFGKMELAGEAGTLLKIEEEIQSSINEAKDQWQARSGSNSIGDMFQEQLDQETPQKGLSFDLSGVDDELFWDGAEQLILNALSTYANKAESNTGQKRLFADDAAKGFAFIDLCRKRFDVVLMNPPFGQFSDKTYKWAESKYKGGHNDIYAAFLMRAVSLLCIDGCTGAISSSSFLRGTSLEDLRDAIINRSLLVCADLGLGVMDDAWVESAAFTLQPDSEIEHLNFYDLRERKGKEEELRQCVTNHSVLIRKRSLFKNTPNKSILYDISEAELIAFQGDSSFLDPSICEARSGLRTFDNERFVRLWWEVPEGSIGDDCTWRYFSKGGEYELFYQPLKLVVNWGEDGLELAEKNRTVNGQTAQARQGSSLYFRQGFTFPSRSELGFCARAFPEGAIFSSNGPAILRNGQISNYVLAALLNSTKVRSFIDVQSHRRSYSPGLLGRVPYRELPTEIEMVLESLAKKLINEKAKTYLMDETTPIFSGKISFNRQSGQLLTDILRAEEKSEADQKHKLYSWIKEIDSNLEPFYGRPDSEPNYGLVVRQSATWSVGPKDFASKILHFSMGVIFDRLKTSSLIESENDSCEFDPFEALSGSPLAMKDGGTLNLAVDPHVVRLHGYLTYSVFDSDDGHIHSLIANLKSTLTLIWGEEEEHNENELANILGVKSLEDYFFEGNTGSRFFSDHLRRYSGSRRQAPIYLPISTLSGKYTIWFCYSNIEKQLLYLCINDFIEPKMKKMELRLFELKALNSRSVKEEKELENYSDIYTELQDLRDEILKIASFWRPNKNDGVLVCMAPLWKLFQQKAWQKKLKETWEKLEKGDYDWSHMACSIWPERVLRKCHQDRSLAIAHDVEDTFWHEVEVPVMRGKKPTSETKLEWQPKALTDDEIGALIHAKVKQRSV
jgi:hypothetical protein